VDFSSDGKYLATGGRDNQIIIWDIESVPAVKIKSFVNRSPIVSVIFINSDTIIFAGEDGSVILRNIKSDDLIPIYKSDTGKPLCLAWNKKEKILFAGCSDGSLFSFKDKFSVTSKYTGHTAGIEMIRFNSDFSLFATASRDRTIRLYFYNEFFNRGNTVGGSVHLKNINSRVRSMCFTSNNKLAAGLSDRMIYVWETSSEKLASDICTLIHRDLTSSEWNDIVGTDIPYEKCCQTKFLR
jgi:WD40 repeat protein